MGLVANISSISLDRWNDEDEEDDEEEEGEDEDEEVDKRDNGFCNQTVSISAITGENPSFNNSNVISVLANISC
jgi:hypothetical protein